jgi:hypothetical protein
VSTTGDATQTAKDQAGQVAQTGKEQAGAVAGHAGSAAKEVAGTATEQAKNVAAEAKAQAVDLVGQTRDQLREQAGQQQQKAASSIRSLAGELHEMANSAQTQGTAASLARQAADRGHALAGYLENSEPEQLLEDVRDFARRKPGLFLAGAAVAGFVAARMVKGARAANGGGSTSQRFEAYPTDTSYEVGSARVGGPTYGLETDPTLVTGQAYETPALAGGYESATTDPAYERSFTSQTGYPTEEGGATR